MSLADRRSGATWDGRSGVCSGIVLVPTRLKFAAVLHNKLMCRALRTDSFAPSALLEDGC